MLESNQGLIGQGIDELNGKKWVTGGLSVDELGQRRCALRLTMQGILNQVCQVAGAERRQTDLLDWSSGPTDCRQLLRERVRRLDLIVPIGANYQQVRHIFLDQQILQKIERRRVQPLEIVEKQAQRMVRACENAKESSKCKVRTNFRLLRRQRGDRWLFSDN